MGATLTPQQIAKLSPEHQALLASTDFYTVTEALSLAVTSGVFPDWKRTDIKDLLVAACADGVIQCEKHGRRDYDIQPDSFNEWLELHTIPEPAALPMLQQPARKLDLSLIPLFIVIALLINLIRVIFT